MENKEYEKNNPILEKRVQEIEKEIEAGEETNPIDEGEIQEFFLHPISVFALLNEKTEEIKWLIERLIPAGGLTIISGSSGHFKTWVALSIAKSIYSGKPLFGQFKTQKVGVLIINEENLKRILRERFKKLGLEKNEENLPLFYTDKESFKIDDKRWVRGLLKLLSQTKIKLIIIDCLIRVHSGDENDARTIAKIYDNIKKIQKLGVSVIIIHHHRKQSNSYGGVDSQNLLRGSSDILAMADSHLIIRKEGKEGLVIKQSKCRQEEEISPFKVSIKKENGITFEYSGEHKEKKKEEKNQIEKAKDMIIELLSKNKRNFFRNDIDEKLKEKIGGKNISNALIELEKNNRIKSNKKGKKKFYWIKEDESPL